MKRTHARSRQVHLHRVSDHAVPRYSEHATLDPVDVVTDVQQQRTWSSRARPDQVHNDVPATAATSLRRGSAPTSGGASVWIHAQQPVGERLSDRLQEQKGDADAEHGPDHRPPLRTFSHGAPQQRVGGERNDNKKRL
jgi:hypothetical protein